jgi:hypothetical protein
MGTATCSLSPATANWPTLTSGHGSARRHSSKRVSIVASPPVGRFSANSPFSGTQILSVQASQVALARIGTWPVTPGGAVKRTRIA